jgi:hypothetical protein
VRVALVITTSAGVLAALSTLFRMARRGWRRVREIAMWVEVIHNVVERELREGGGGNSVKNNAADTRRIVAELAGEMRAGDSAVAQMLDNLNAYWQLEHDAIWESLVEIGIDRRRRPEARRFTA